ncbi:MAG: DUF4298 domain-containing protein [Lachnospiraceae bacterium]|nr:DUF4298 domain-containing protein [Lachnospiraceae bacterium]
MDKYIWIFPVLFIFHDMEEVIWLPGFIDKNREDIIKRYIPSLVTSIMTLPPSIMLLIHTKWDMSVFAVIGTIIGIAGVAANLKLAHLLMGWYDICSKRRDQIRRIQKYEKIMCEAKSMIEVPSEDEMDSLCEKIKELETYYGSEDWKQDFSDDEAGLLPPDLKRGVL